MCECFRQVIPFLTPYQNEALENNVRKSSELRVVFLLLMHTISEAKSSELVASTPAFLLSLNLNIGIAYSDNNHGSLCGHCMNRQRSLTNVAWSCMKANQRRPSIRSRRSKELRVNGYKG